MKKTLLWSALFTLLTTQTQAANEPGNTPPPTSPPPTVQTPPTEQAAPQQAPIPTAPAATPEIPQITPNSTAPQPPINCDYKIPAEVKTVDPQLVTTWTEKAVLQAFDFDPTILDVQIQKLQACFTEQGWSGFNTAFQKSGNLEAIKAQKLHVSSQIDGQVQLIDTKDNQWKLTLPLQVVYQNDKEKVTQLLQIEVSVSRKINGDLGIIQMIATPRVEKQPSTVPGGVQPSVPSNPAVNTPNTTTPPSYEPPQGAAQPNTAQ